MARSLNVKTRQMLAACAVIEIPLGSAILNLSLIWGSNITLASARGSLAFLILATQQWAVVVCPSGQLKILNPTLSTATQLRVVKLHQQTDLGTRRHSDPTRKVRGVKTMLFKGNRPQVRGVAKNSNDHPHGGNSNGVLRPKSPWAKTIKKSPAVNKVNLDIKALKLRVKLKCFLSSRASIHLG